MRYKFSIFNFQFSNKFSNFKFQIKNSPARRGFTLIKHSEVFSKGFTLIELLIVIVLIGILSTFGLENFQNAQKKGRDAQRKSDLKQVQNALEAYNNDEGKYPASSAGVIMISTSYSGCSPEDFIGSGSVFFSCDPGRRSPCSETNAARYKAACDVGHWDGGVCVSGGEGYIDICDFSRVGSGTQTIVWGSPFAAGGTLYLEKLPGDPTGTPQYCYKAPRNGSKYQLFAKLENASDPQAVSGLPSCGTSASGVYNFGVSSPNAGITESL